MTAEEMPREAAELLAAWDRTKMPEASQLAWKMASRQLDAALDANLAPDLMPEFGGRIRRLAAVMVDQEPLLGAGGLEPRLAFWVGMHLAGELLVCVASTAG